MNIYKINFGETSGYGVKFIKAKSQIEILDILRLAEYPSEYLEDLDIKISRQQIWKFIKDEFKIEKSKILNSDNYQTLLGE